MNLVYDNDMKRLLIQAFLRQHSTKLVALLAWLVILTAFYRIVRQNHLSLEETIYRLAIGLSDGFFGPLFFIILYVLGPLLFFPAVVLTVLGGFLFGPIGILYTIVGSNSSAMVAYTVGRYFSQDMLETNTQSGVIQRYTQRMRNNSFETVLIMHLIFLPFELVNYACGFLQINWKAFLAATAIGSVPATISFVLLGASFGSVEELLAGDIRFNPTLLAISLLLIGSSITFSQYIKRRESNSL